MAVLDAGQQRDDQDSTNGRLVDARGHASRGFTIGSHTKTHVWLGHESEARNVDELAGSKQELERRLGAPVHHFAYPGSVHAAGRGARRPRRISLRLYRLRASGCGPSRADHSAAAVVGGIVDRRRRPIFVGDSRLSDAPVVAACAPMRTGARCMTAMLKRVYHVLGQDGVSAARAPFSSPAARSASLRRSPSPWCSLAPSIRRPSAPASSCS